MQTENLMRYVAAMGVFKGWYESGLISGDELRQIDTMFREKYGLDSCSIFAGIGSISPQKP